MDNKVFLRNVVGEYMNTLGSRNPKVVVVNADLAVTCRNTLFAKEFPTRTFNVGIAEQNMVSFASGLAHEGFKPYVFSMAPFLSMRACEQVRTDVAYGNKNVKLIAVYAGVSGGISGATHWAIEDCGIISSIPNMTIFEVSDGIIAKKIMDYSLTTSKPMYIRLGVDPVQNVHSSDLTIVEGGSEELISGKDGYILCSGVVVFKAVEASKMLKEKYGLDVGVIDMYSIKPLDKSAINKASKTNRIIVAQDHNVVGGLGSLISQHLSENNLNCNFKILGITDEFSSMAHAPYLYSKYKLDCSGIVSSFLKLISKGE